MELTLNRKIKLADRTIGELLINGVKFCDTLEDVERLFFTGGKLLGIKIYGETAIPKGRYEIAITYSNRFKKMLPLLMNVPQFEGIRIHPGNVPADTHGCLLVGTHDKKTNNVVSSRIAFDKLMVQLQNTKGKIFITIS